MRNREMPDGGRLSERLRTFGKFVSEDSPSYSRVCMALADDPTVLQILGGASYDQPVANLLFGAVQYLLLEGAETSLATHYPSIVGTATRPTGDLVDLFGEFCREQEPRLGEIVATRTVQTNEVRRSTILMPAFAWTSHRVATPLALVEIGASAGLNLLFDRYRYDYGGGTVGGSADSPLVLSSELRAGVLPSIDPLPPVIWRRGIDLHPVDVTAPDAVRWVRALMWPEQLERIRRFETAIEMARSDPPPVIAGDAVEILGRVAATAPPEATLLVFHSFVLNQLSGSARRALDEAFVGLSSGRDVHRVGFDMISRDATPEIRHTVYAGGIAGERTLGLAHHHGAWLEWTA